MARYSVGVRSNGAGSTTLPVGSLYAAANNDLHVVEIGVFNTTTTAVNLAVRRLTSAGTQGTGLSEIPWDPDTTAATGTAFDTHSSTGPTLTAGFYTHASRRGDRCWCHLDVRRRGTPYPEGNRQRLVHHPGHRYRSDPRLVLRVGRID